ncbi:MULTISPECIES: 5'/3'-nucleotidase SurE [unclassified Nitratiruptor]|uniref:5'/3'-nucleotidase SurE n=1 Tax=unclassified Nitratiruptor TaxID=2624044 RepID=UPI001915D5DC|nr:MULTISPECIES: 5'/3'-nucleotidase SurE [unclassified Nitratiruptor]BCD60634.1 5'-nucleotidase [Nitratiruptor sp. YY08-10]BCD64565.1 5'-nucleotidase [Nitratiruptor sp. YY08-14]
MKRILITNDDGFESLGLRALIEALQDIAQLTIVVPANEKSACGHSLTLTKPLRFVEIEDNFYKLEDGTPTDCVYLALSALYPENEKPDIIVSGINRGANMGEDITYSGTVAGAMEGAIYDIPSIAISQVCNSNCEETEMEVGYEQAKHVARDLVQKIFQEGWPAGHRKCLNVNVPSTKEFKGYKITRAGYRVYFNQAHLHRNPRGIEYWWLGLHPLDWIPGKKRDCDFEAVKNGYVSITPIKADLTAYEEIPKLKSWL